MTKRVDVRDRTGDKHRVSEGPFPVRVTKTALEWLMKNGPQSLRDLFAPLPVRADGAIQLILDSEQLRELWWAMDVMLEEQLGANYRPGINSAVGMQRKIEAHMPGVPW